jgi:hypothetical protein
MRAPRAIGILIGMVSSVHEVWECVDDDVARILAKKTPGERIRMVTDGWRVARLMLEAQVRRMEPGWSDELVEREVSRRMLAGST